MIIDHVCRKCGSTNLCRSRATNRLEKTLRPFITMYRCFCCNLRQAKLRSIKVGSNRDMRNETYQARW